MDMIAAARDTLALARERNLDDVSSDTPELDYNHLAWMLSEMESKPEKFSPAKMGRWLGWMQAAVVAQSCGDISLEDMKQINMRNADDPEEKS